MFVLAFSLGLTAASSFRRERETGVMQLLLITPMSERQIIWGRLRGLWGRFLPAIIVVLGLQLYIISRGWGRASDLIDWSYYGAAYATVPAIGLFFSLRCRNFVLAGLLTTFLGLALPVVAPAAVEILYRLFGGDAGMRRSFAAVLHYGPALFNEWQRLAATVFTQLSVAALLAWRLHRRLVTRSFALERSVT